jgi:galactofuranosylgalactofuranosylrhamnosyl-N-acetylglucosaminyl-diphospho-decaprenol beta-1,5/1,6-galactofuranosyltransferase
MSRIESEVRSIAATRQAMAAPEPVIHVIQNIICSGPGVAECEGVYFSQLRGTIHKFEDGLYGGNDSIVGFNTYVNSLYVSYWVKETNVDSFFLTGKVKGKIGISVFRSRGSQGVVQLGTFLAGSTDGTGDVTRFCIPLSVLELASSESSVSSRIFFDIHFISEAHVFDLSFATDVPPIRSVVFSIGLCTFGKERQLANNLRNLSAYRGPGWEKIGAIFVVNQGPLFTNARIASITAADRRSRVIQQENLGGAGGFTRSLVEALDVPSVSHHIMMDDDIFLDPAVIGRAAIFIEFARKDILLGGHMLNLKAPHEVYEAGAKLDRQCFIVQQMTRFDTRDVAALIAFDTYLDADYNAWWFCAIPLHRITESGLPLDIFIRGDDFEFGLRMKRMGVYTVSLPGVFVWHDPFEGKTAAWLEYYNLRNRMIVASVHAPDHRMHTAAMLRQMLSDTIARDRYDVFVAKIMALCDVIEGPEFIFSNSALELHARLRHTLKLCDDFDEIGKVEVAASFVLKTLCLAGADPVQEEVHTSAGLYAREIVDMLLLHFDHFSEVVQEAWVAERSRSTRPEYWNRYFRRTEIEVRGQ